MSVIEDAIPFPDGTARKVWLQPAESGTPQKLAVFLDAEFYVHRMDAPAILREFPVSVIYISHKEPAARHSELTCNEMVGEWVINEVVPWAMERLEISIQEGHLIAGLSLSGLQAACISLWCPEVFPLCLSQSGSFWWNDEWLTRNLVTVPPARFWISVGDQETQAGLTHSPSNMRQNVSQVDACHRFHDALRKGGHETHLHVFEGGHDTSCWRAELPDAMRFLFDPAQEKDDFIAIA